MKSSTLKLKDFIIKGDVKTVIYASYLREGFAERSIQIKLNNSNNFQELYFNSNKYGSVIWKNKIGLTDCHYWETEDEAQKVSDLSRHYTSLLADGVANVDFARKLIIPDILSQLKNNKLSNIINEIINLLEYNKPLDLAIIKS